jgi:hypothetical protein
MSGVHGTLGWLALVAGMIVTLSALAAWYLGTRAAGRLLARVTDLLVVLVTALVLAAMFVGGLLLMTGLRPIDMLHVLYGIAAPAALPIAMGLGIWDGGRGRRHRRHAWVAGGGVVLVVLSLLLAMSG